MLRQATCNFKSKQIAYVFFNIYGFTEFFQYHLIIPAVPTQTVYDAITLVSELLVCLHKLLAENECVMTQKLSGYACCVYAGEPTSWQQMFVTVTTLYT